MQVCGLLQANNKVGGGTETTKERSRTGLLRTRKKAEFGKFLLIEALRVFDTTLKFRDMTMMLQKPTEALLLLVLGLTISKCNGDGSKEHCKYLQNGPSDDLILNATSDLVNKEKLKQMKTDSRVCWPQPCDHLEAYSGFIPVEENKFMFFLHIKSEEDPEKKPLLLWLQGGPGKSSLYGELLENGPLGINANGTPYFRSHTLLKHVNLLYVDQPVGAGYSFGQSLTGKLEETSIHLMRLIRRFLRIFDEYKDRDFYVAGESYGARSAVGVAQKIITRKPEQLPLNFKGIMLGVGFLFDLIDIINSGDYLYASGLLDENARYKFASQFEVIQSFVDKKEYEKAAGLLSQTVLNLRPKGEKSLFQKLTGFEHHGSIAYAERPREAIAYMEYANSTEFKKIIHVKSSRVLDGTRYQLGIMLALQDFFVDITTTVEFVLNNVSTLFYTAEYDAVFPAENLERNFRKLKWERSKAYQTACRRLWRKKDKSGKLLGYVKRVQTLLHATVLFGGHYISLDCSEAVSELYEKFLNFVTNNGEDNAGEASEELTPTCTEFPK